MTQEVQDRQTIRELTAAELDEVSGGLFDFKSFSTQFNIGANIAVVPQINIAVLSSAVQFNIANVGQWVSF
jgi:hypothetical protein